MGCQYLWRCITLKLLQNFIKWLFVHIFPFVSHISTFQAVGNISYLDLIFHRKNKTKNERKSKRGFENSKKRRKERKTERKKEWAKKIKRQKGIQKPQVQNILVRQISKREFPIIVSRGVRKTQKAEIQFQKNKLPLKNKITISRSYLKKEKIDVNKTKTNWKFNQISQTKKKQ